MRQWMAWLLAVAAMAPVQPAAPAAEPFEATGRVLTGGRIFAIAAADVDATVGQTSSCPTSWATPGCFSARRSPRSAGSSS